VVLLKIKKILNKAIAEAIPSETEQKHVNELSQELTQIINEQAEQFSAKLMVGGSVAKGTWLPHIHDIDCFLRFNYIKYKDKSELISNIAEKILKKCFKNLTRLHGSRDYFQTRYNKCDIEIIPVLDINSPDLMKNITDVSPLHFNWLSKKTKQNNLATEIRLAKQFFKANNLYGAESFIRSFSGHVIEVLTIHYGGFIPLLKAISKWQDTAYVDSEHKYTDKKQMMLLMNESKTISPLIVVDPIQPERNAAAALSNEKFIALKKIVNRFLNNPTISYFKEKKVTINQIKSCKTKNELILITICPESNVTIDVAGCKLLKQFEYIEKNLIDFDFKIAKKSWYWDKKTDAILWFYINPQKLSKVFRHFGPPTTLTQHAEAFRKQWEKFDVKTIKDKLYVDFPRKIRTVDDFLNELRKDKNIQIKIL